MAFKMNGMGFGMGTGLPPENSAYNKKVDSSHKFLGRNTVSSKLKDEGVNEAGHQVKSKSGINLFGQTRNVKKYYDPKTNEYLGKEVSVTKKDGSKKMYGGGLFGTNVKGKQDVKIKTPAGIKEGGIGKIRQAKGYFDGAKTPEIKPSGGGKPKGRVEYASSKPELREFVKTDNKGNKSLSTYNQAWDDGRFTTKDGKRTDKFGNTYTDDEAGKKKFIQASKKFWDDMANKPGEENESLLIDSQTGKKQVYSPTKYKRFGRKKKKK